MSNRFRPAWLLVLAALSTSALAKAPETVNIGYQKANIFALLKYRGTLDESLKKQVLPYAGSNSPPDRKCWRG